MGREISSPEMRLQSAAIVLRKLEKDRSRRKKVKKAMAAGQTVVLHNHDAIYESLYDVLNQRFLVKVDQVSGVRRKPRIVHSRGSR